MTRVNIFVPVMSVKANVDACLFHQFNQLNYLNVDKHMHAKLTVI